MARRKKPFTQFFSMLDKCVRADFVKEAYPIVGCCRSTFYYKTVHGNLYPSEAVKIKDVLVKYGATEEDLYALGVLG